MQPQQSSEQAPALQPQGTNQQPAPQQPQLPPQQNATSGLAIAALVLAFVFAPAGLVLGIVALTKKLIGGNKIMAILAVVFGALNTLFIAGLILLSLASFAGIQQRAHETNVETVARSMQKQVEAYNGLHDSFPTTAQVASRAWLKENFTGVDETTIDEFLQTGTYRYESTPAECQNTTDSQCTDYEITYRTSDGEQKLESSGIETMPYRDDTNTATE